VLAVVASHTGANVFRGGAVGVDVFFVLSGFLITTLLVAEFDQYGRISIRNFYVRRLLRLFPALVAVLVFVSVTFPIFRPYLTGETMVGVPASLFYVSSWLRAFDISQLGWLGHTWSLSVEEHFYLLWPMLLILICRRSRERLVCWVGLAFAAAATYRAVAEAAGASGNRLYNSPDMRAEQLLCGCLLAVILVGRTSDQFQPWLRRAFAILFAGSCVLLSALMAIPNRYVAPRLFSGSPSTYFQNGISTLIAVLSAVIIGHLFLWPASWVGRALSTRPLVWVGRRSYGIYLWDTVLLGLFYLKGEPNAIRWSVRFVMIFVCIGVAGLSYRFIETPFLAKRPRSVARASYDREVDPGVAPPSGLG
jgi:peptidoglycan/LPS O-acetylase OafA/YrhL